MFAMMVQDQKLYMLWVQWSSFIETQVHPVYYYQVKLVMGPYWRQYKSNVYFFLPLTTQLPNQDVSSDDQTQLGVTHAQIVSSGRFTLKVRVYYVQPKSSIPIGAKVEIGLKRFTLGAKAE